MNRGKQFEQKFGRSAGGKRTPRSGAVGGGDISFGAREGWGDWSWELKERATLPKLITNAMNQAESDIAIGDPRRPAVALREEGGRTLVVFFWDDLETWVSALTETSNAAKLRMITRQLLAVMRELEAAIR